MNVYRKFPEENNKNPNSTTKSGFQQNENKKEIKEINIKKYTFCVQPLLFMPKHNRLPHNKALV